VQEKHCQSGLKNLAGLALFLVQKSMHLRERSLLEISSDQLRRIDNY